MGQEISILQLILNASIVVQIVIGILLFFSIISWGIIFSKWISLRLAKNQTYSFLKQFQNASNVSTLYTSILKRKNKRCTTAIFFNGINEYNKINKQGITNKHTIIENLERSITSTIDAEIDIYEQSLPTLATFGSVSPYIGLLGTVWGIMHAFIGLGNTGQATIATVAPGIAEALVATAIGLFVAIPAYIFYNKFTADVISLNSKMTKFGDDFLNLISRRINADNSQDKL
ncbi:MAG TPA: protein TolQ [Burkholderiales bacterium]|nr:protein TolQ [Burkholderiales bacterium]